MHTFDKYKEKLITFYEQNKRMPGYNEMMALFGFKSKNSVHKLIKKLVDEGIVEKDSQGKISPLRLYGEIRVLGSVQAGFPTPAEEELMDTMSLDEFLIKKKSATYMLTVSGDSMINAGIHPGDMVIVEKTDSAKEGDIVIALVDGDWTMKYLRHKNDTFYLEAANPNYPDIHPENEMNIGGVVRSVIRKYF